MTKDKVTELAKAMASAEEAMNWMGMGNTPTDPVKRVESRARYSLAMDIFEARRKEYNAAFDAWKAEGFPGL